LHQGTFGNLELYASCSFTENVRDGVKRAVPDVSRPLALVDETDPKVVVVVRAFAGEDLRGRQCYCEDWMYIA